MSMIDQASFQPLQAIQNLPLVRLHFVHIPAQPRNFGVQPGYVGIQPSDEHYPADYCYYYNDHRRRNGSDFRNAIKHGKPSITNPNASGAPVNIPDQRGSVPLWVVWLIIRHSGESRKPE